MAECEHLDIVPIHKTPDGTRWGRCEACGDDTFVISGPQDEDPVRCGTFKEIIDLNARRAARGEVMFAFAPFAFQGEGAECPSVGVIDGEQPICLMTEPPLNGICMTRADALALGKELIACAEAKEGMPENPQVGDLFTIGGQTMRVLNTAYGCSCGSKDRRVHAADCPFSDQPRAAPVTGASSPKEE